MNRLKENVTGYVLLAPALIMLGLFVIIPIIYSFGLSFYSWDMLRPNPTFVGLDNYSRLLSDEEFYLTLKRTLLYALMTVPASMLLGLIFALLLDKGAKAWLLAYRSVFFAPMVTSAVAISVVWMWIYHPDHGLMNAILKPLGIGPFRWLNDEHTSLVSLAIMSIWKSSGYCVILYLAGLQSIDPHVEEAARMDGANGWHIVRHIKVPLLGPMTLLMLILQTIEQFQTFTQVNVMTQGGPAQSTELLVVQLYHYAFEMFQMGYASAIAITVFIIILALTLLQMAVVGRRVHYQ
ncbi:carbohydrate ABC transporter permease [Paenibacillus cremeus]|uniref:Sugar ABC transporter permease n=1 Tax=Paenibacillus cremeus TaxID=2163881 RepID=A0A559JPR6_9BACL|nr:sugar ABC transporter permease [Paenibacillus cremeus]TVY01869.1 sugar ABC transporter permease [Paenibacillus cremeus]